MPCLMFAARHALGKHQSFYIDSPQPRLFPKIINGVGIILEQPQHAAFHHVKYAYPRVKRAGCNFKIVIKATEYEAGCRQTQLFSGNGFFTLALFVCAAIS